MVIKSSRSDAVIEFSMPREEFVEVSLARHDLKARRLVSLYTNPTGIAALFRSMADEWRGWSGPKSWESLEGEMALAAVHDGVGHITLRVALVNLDAGEPWKLETELELEPGALEALAKASEAHFRGSHG